MSAYDRLLADQVAATITAAGLYSPTNNAAIDSSIVTVNYLPRYEPKDLTDLRIVIAPRSRATTPLSRTSRRREHSIQIAIMQTADPDSDLFLGLFDLVGSIDETLAAANYAAATASVNRWGLWLRNDVTLYDVQALEQHGIFRSVITATYQINT
jgi:hypothetical protein